MERIIIKKERLDNIIYNKGLTKSRERAKALIMSGKVYINNQKADKPGVNYPVDVIVDLRDNEIPYVSRGGLKLEKAIIEFNIDLKDKLCMDVGASTGGFTDCMLQNGALKVYSVDVGYGQLDWKLRNDNRVINLEKTNIRYLSKDTIKEKIDFLSIDVSFISLKLVLPVIKEFLSDGAEVLCLIKPQFEAGKDNVGKNGVVRDESIHKQVVEDIAEFCKIKDFNILNLSYSPIKGPKGNIEYLLHLSYGKNKRICSNIDIKRVVYESHRNLNVTEGSSL